jgi:glutamate--cysteine ligase
MTTSQITRLNRLLDNDSQYLLCGGLKGIEKESLRISKDSLISQKPHPRTLGSALTHPQITTDYSEALIELITPAFSETKSALGYLEVLHQVVYHYLEDEILLSASMPCGIKHDECVPIAQYGNSNIGKMKHVYRHGLWHRYGRTMQAIAGIHFNYSVPEQLWPVLHKLEKSDVSVEHYIADNYFGLIRNFQRCGWIILYLFGASPAICKSFFNSRPQLMEQFEEFGQGTLYHPYATSLRMSDIGYKSKNQQGLKINYNSLPAYIDSLSRAIATPYADYEAIGVEVNGEYRQLNANILQIENEFYSIIRPKQIAHSGEKPTIALKKRGVRYVEMRSLDLDLFYPTGIDESKSLFIEALLITCLLTESPPMNEADFQANNRNQLQVANNGRKPGLKLERKQTRIGLKDWALEILDSMSNICRVLDKDNETKPYSDALLRQRQVVENPDLAPSARMLAIMTETKQSFSKFALTKSLEHADYFRRHPIDKDRLRDFDLMAQASIAKQNDLEQQPQIPFHDFLEHYFAQQ